MPIESLSTEPEPGPKAIMMYEPAETKKCISEVRDWRTSKYPLRLIIREYSLRTCGQACGKSWITWR